MSAALAGEYHAILDEAAAVDADSIEGSNSTYEFAGTSVADPSLLYTRIYPCVCRRCRERSAVHQEYSACPYMTTVGKFQQRTIHEASGVNHQRQIKKATAEAFGRGILADKLYAAYASYDELGNRKYWLLCTASKMYVYKPKKAAKGARGATIKKGTLVVDAHWYVSTSSDQMRKSYKLRGDEKVTIPVASLVQEHNLEWAREMRGGTNCESILANSSHLALMQHNYSNTK